MNTIKIPISYIEVKNFTLVFNKKIKFFLQRREDGVFEIFDVFDYSKVQYVSWNTKELEIRYL